MEQDKSDSRNPRHQRTPSEVRSSNRFYKTHHLTFTQTVWDESIPFQNPLEFHKGTSGVDANSEQVLWNAICKHDDEMCKSLKEDGVDTLLVFVCVRIL